MIFFDIKKALRLLKKQSQKGIYSILFVFFALRSIYMDQEYLRSIFITVNVNIF